MATTNQAASFAEAGVTLHAKLMNAVQAATVAAAPAGGNNNNSNNNSHAIISPTPLLTRVLRRTAADFADVIVDGRCATGSRQVGSAAAVWVHHNAAMRSAGGGGGNSAATSPSTSAATTAAGGTVASTPTAAAGGSGSNNSGASSSSPTSASAATNNNSNNGSSGGSITPLYFTEAALNECRNLLALYSFHCLLTASQLYNNSASGPSHHVHPCSDGRVHQLPASANHWAPEVSFIIAETEASAEELLKICRWLAEACNANIQVSTAIGSKTPASLIVRSISATGTSSASSSGGAAGSGKEVKTDGDANKKEEKKKGTEWPCAASIIITTTHSFLNWNMSTLLNAGVEVAVAEEEGDAETNKDNNKEAVAVRTKRVFPHIASIVVEEIGRATTSGTASAEKALQQWRDAHAAFIAAATRQHVRYPAPAHVLPHVLWICRGPVSRLPTSLRQLLSRRSRRYYQLQPSTYVSSAAVALMPQPQDGLSIPAESLGMRLVLSQSTADKDAQLRRIVTDRSGLYHRVLVLTHNKEVPQLNMLITSWGVSREYPMNTSASSGGTASNANSNSNNVASTNANSGGGVAAGPVLTDASPNYVHSTRRLDSAVAQYQCHTSYLNICEAAERATMPITEAIVPPAAVDDAVDNGAAAAAAAAAAAGAAPTSSSSPSSPVVVTLVAWDAFTALDVMDVDVIVQYYPPQKSLTEQEWAEFIQLLHTTIDGEREIELSLRQNRNNKEDNIRAKLSQLMQATTTGLDSSAAVTAAAATTSGSPAPPRITPHRPLPVVVTLMVAADFTLTAYFLHQYLYSGASGALTQAATTASLASIVQVPGKPGVLEPVEHPMPVLDIAPEHPYFIPLVCGHDGGAEWPDGAAGSPPKARETVVDGTAVAGGGAGGGGAALLTHFTSGEALNVRKVLAVKLAKEQSRTGAGKSPTTASAATSPTTTTAAQTAGGAASPLVLLAQGIVSMGGSSTVAGGAGKAAAADNNNLNNTLARLVAKNSMNASTGINQGDCGGGARPQGAGSVSEASAGWASGGGNIGAKGTNNTQKSNNNSSGKGNKSNIAAMNVNSSSTISSSAAPTATGNANSGGGGGAGQTDNQSSTPSATSSSVKTGGSKRRQRNKGGNNNNNNNKKAGAQPSS